MAIPRPPSVRARTARSVSWRSKAIAGCGAFFTVLDRGFSACVVWCRRGRYPILLMCTLRRPMAAGEGRRTALFATRGREAWGTKITMERLEAYSRKADSAGSLRGHAPRNRILSFCFTFGDLKFYVAKFLGQSRAQPEGGRTTWRRTTIRHDFDRGFR